MKPFVPPLGAMLLTQTAASMSLSTVPVLAPAIALDVGVDPSNVGIYAAMVFATAMLTSSASGVAIERFGPFRSNQLVVIASAMALLVCLWPSIVTITLSALALGAAYGPNTPSSAQVLARVTPLDRRGLVFSVKQSGSPFGAMLAGLILPGVALAFGWQAAVILAAVLIALSALVVNPLRAAADRTPAADSGVRERPSVSLAMRTILSSRTLRRLTAAGFLLMMVHTCLQAFTVTVLVEHVGLSLVFAGHLFAALSVSAFVARIMLGWLSDSLFSPSRLLTVIAALAVVSCLAMVRLSSASPVWEMFAVCALAGFASSGWYGVFLAEVSRRAEPGHEGLATGGALFFVYSSIVGGPLLFMATRLGFDGYAASLYLLAAVSALAALSFARLRD